MVSFMNDVDILRYEPVLFGELYLPGQVLAEGTGGALSGTTFTAADADFTGLQVAAGGAIYLRSADGSVDGAFEIVSVDSATQLTVSVLRSESSDEPIAPASGEDVSYRVSTYRPQAEEVSFNLAERLGIRPGRADSEIGADDVLDDSVLKQVCVFGVLSQAYATLASKREDEGLWSKSLHYKRLFEQARERCQVCFDVDGDGVGDSTRFGGCGKLVRD